MAEPRILCCGEALIDMAPVGGDYRPLVGGSVFNTAIALGRLGAPVGFFSGLSTDHFGDRLVSALEGSGVDHRLASRADRPTTLAFLTIVDGEATYAFYDENTAGRMLGEADVPAIPGAVAALYFGGISLISEPAASAYEALALRAAAAGKVVMVDANIRPDFAADAADYRRRIMAMIAAADIVKVSEADLDWLIPGPTGAEEKLATLCAQGRGLGVLTRGEAGAYALRPGHAPVTAPAERAEVVDTVGAGDTFNAGLLAALDRAGALTRAGLAELDDDEVKEALAFGAKVAAITVTREGADPPWAAELGMG